MSQGRKARKKGRREGGKMFLCLILKYSIDISPSIWVLHLLFKKKYNFQVIVFFFYHIIILLLKPKFNADIYMRNN